MHYLKGGKKIITVFSILPILAGFFICSLYDTLNAWANLPGIVINEVLVGSDSESKREFIELYNPTNMKINLENYSLKKKTKSGSESNLISSTKFIGIIPAKGFFVIAHPNYADEFNADLSYSGSSYSIANNSTIILYNSDEEIIDLLGYGEASEAETIATLNPANNESIERKMLGEDSNNNFFDFKINFNPSPGTYNTINNNEVEILDEKLTASNSDNAVINENNNKTNNIPSKIGLTRPKAEEQYDYSTKIYLSEILPNPIGTDEEEFIELYNAGETSVNLFGWTIEDSSKNNYKLASTIQAQSYLLIKRRNSKIALNNSGDTVSLYLPLASIPDQIIKYENAPSEQSYNCIYFEKGELINTCHWSDNISAGKTNIVKHINHPPQVDFDCLATALVGQPIRFISSDTIDKDDDIISFYWDFGDGITNTLANPEHTYLNKGKYTIKLSVSDAEFIENLEKTIIINSVDKNENIEYKIIISEFMPNPTGADNDGEWIEIYNQGKTRVNLRDWQIDDNEQGSRPFTVIEDRWLDPGAYFLFDREETGLALNNTSDSVRLLDYSKQVVDAVDYKNVSENLSLARDDNNKWQWTLESTPGENNIIKINNTNQKKKSSYFKTRLDISLEKIQNLNSGDMVRTHGTVAVLPGVFGSQYFYIIDSSGVQIYNYKKKFPNLRIGDYIEVNGEISEIYGEKRIKTKTIDDIKILEHLEESSTHQYKCEDINELSIGKLINLNGEVVERKGSSIYLDDGSNECLIYIKTGTNIKASAYKEGDKISITGIIVKTKSDVRVQPRNKDDIIRQNIKKTQEQVLGEISKNTEWDLPTRDNKQKLYQYLLITFGTIIIVLGIFVFRLNK